MAYWDIYKYYSNKQEGIGVQILDTDFLSVFSTATVVRDGNNVASYPRPNPFTIIKNDILIIEGDNLDLNNIKLTLEGGAQVFARNYFDLINNTGNVLKCVYKLLNSISLANLLLVDNDIPSYGNLKLETFPLQNIDLMRETILSKTMESGAFILNQDCNIKPYRPVYQNIDSRLLSKRVQNGLGIKTYQSDIFNNWLSSEFIYGVNGISEITAVDTSSGSFSIDTLNLSKKVYDMLNRIAVSGGWLS